MSTGEDYVRVKRRNQTFFIHTTPSDTFAQIKAEISQAMGGDDAISPKQMRLYIETPKEESSSEKKDDDDNDGDEDMGGNKNSSNISKDLVPDAAILSDHGIKNDAVLYVTFAKGWEDGDDVPEDDDGWEEIEIVKP
mmetsp:Transcript_20368/g.35012  ORF Transcript_20368/g.35012 Transcript_20368/m.35012 type:complete len:137 (+) Transcript_20368:226-636(+)|eukprot:CAMPEP_0183707764 /NCGR_PEP_ID=MMETSP0737-20130205/4242_1 /TAXON_ID=385413 /ORGANISM="Thalassiosira miniscula, Strain CCMP1093" /LENGTH=136 /DNA_ID=CAMNT_0025935493 /DNA_START=169 /DNA_END=579 /DNA_ORIENTATION=+